MGTPISKQEAQVNRWLELAPRPSPLEPEKQWHVFLSYRSVNRNWVLHLYDALRLVGFEVFLDQLEIAAGDSLVSRLNHALGRSQSGVIVWSTRYEDSKWCQDEYESMHTMRNESANFRFVVAKLDDAKLPSFAKKDVFIDFSQYPNGPQGGELLRLMYGLLGQPLPPPALAAAQEIDEESQAALARIQAAKEVKNVAALVGLAKDGGEVWQASPLLYSAAAEALIELDENDRALEVLALASQFEVAIRPIQLKALALARKAKLASRLAENPDKPEAERAAARAEADRLLESAQQHLAELEKLGHRDPETLGIYARTWMDRYRMTGRRIFLEKSRDMYARAFELDKDDYYTGINAASKSVLLGDLETGATLAKKVEGIVGNNAVPGDYWKTATVAETLLLQRKYGDAAKIYRKGVVDAPNATASHASTRDQAALLLNALGAPPETQKKVLEAFDV